VNEEMAWEMILGSLKNKRGLYAPLQTLVKLELRCERRRNY
jgi:hypothetical protein